MCKQKDVCGLISIVVPVYNIAPYLNNCLDSLLAQTYRNLEVIAVDDGSSDGSAIILDEYARKDSRVKVIHKENGGVTVARLCGVNASSGEYIGFCDGDDYVEPDMYARLYENIINYDAAISHCGHRVIRPGKPVEWCHNTGRLVQQDKKAGLTALLEGSMIEPGLCNKLYHHTLFHSLLHEFTMDLSIKINEDLLMNYYLFSMAERTVFEDICPYHYMKRECSASTSKVNHNHVHDPILVKKIIFDECSDSDLEQVAEAALLRTALNIWNKLIMTPSEEFSDDKSEVLSIIKEHKHAISLLGKKQQVFAKMILYTPGLYKVIYKIYRIKKR